MILLKYIHTILLLIGIGFLIYGLFLVDSIVGFISTGLILIILAIDIDRGGAQ